MSETERATRRGYIKEFLRTCDLLMNFRFSLIAVAKVWPRWPR